MTAPHPPKVAGIEPSLPAPAHNNAPTARPVGQLAAVQDRLAGWISDLTTLHDLTEQLARTRTLEDSLREMLRAGASLVGARRGLIALEPADGLGPETTVGLGLGHADIGHLETVPRSVTSYGRLLDMRPCADTAGTAGAADTAGAAGASAGGSAGTTQAVETAAPVPDSNGIDGADGANATDGVTAMNGGARTDGEGYEHAEISQPDIPGAPGLDPRLREVAARLGYAASYAVPLTAAPIGRIGAAVWLYDEPAEPTGRQRHLIGLYRAYATEHLARLLELHRHRRTVATLREELLPSRLPRVPGVRLAVRHHASSHGGGDWYDALPLPDGALGLAVGAVTGTGPGAVAAMGRLRASLRAYAVMEGEDPVSVLSDLELLLRLTEPARSATALFGFVEPAARRVVLAGAGHCPPLIVGGARTEFVETSLSAPLGMLACWEAPSVALTPAPGETLLLYSDGLLHRTGEPMDRALTRLHAAAACAPKSVLENPEALADHVLRTVLPAGLDDPESREDVVLMAAHFE